MSFRKCRLEMLRIWVLNDTTAVESGQKVIYMVHMLPELLVLNLTMTKVSVGWLLM